MINYEEILKANTNSVFATIEGDKASDFSP